MDQSRSDCAGGAVSPAADGFFLLLLCLTVFLGFLTVSLPLPVIPVFVRQKLGFADWIVGCAVGIQFFATVLTRKFAGSMADRLGGHVALRRGLCACTAAGVTYVAADWLPVAAVGKLALLVFGRLALGIGESLFLTGALGWGIALAGPQRSGRVMALVGMAIYGALAAGAPLGLMLAERRGFFAVGLAAAIVPLAGLAVTAGLPLCRPRLTPPVPFRQVLGRIWLPGLGLGLQGVGFAGIGAFVSLYFARMGWAGAGLALTAFGTAFVAVRLLGGGLPDRFGGAGVAAASLAVEAAGLVLLAVAPSALAALVGAGLTGAGCSLVFPALGLEALRRTSPAFRATALGAYAAFQDVAYGLTGPVTGIVAGLCGYRSVFWIGAAAALGGMLTALSLARPKSAGE
jgi:MFS family permease